MRMADDRGAATRARPGAPEAAGEAWKGPSENDRRRALWGAEEFAANRTLRVVVALPDHRLTLNRATSKRSGALRSRLVDEAKHEAVFATFGADLPDLPRPLFPAGVALFVAYDVERRKRGQRWDASGMIEAMKPTLDAWNGILYADDKQIVGFAVRWDAKPTGRGVVTVTIREANVAQFFGK